jgi:NAD(P)-dependent dehydrogenase (short-subunit alcohol dehydrogenase family)
LIQDDIIVIVKNTQRGENTTMSDRYRDKVAFVAGGTGALGRAVSLAFLKDSARVIVTYRRPEEFDDLKNEAGDRAAMLTGHQLDVTDPSAVLQRVQQIVSDFGRIEVLVNAVGSYAGGQTLWSTPPEVFDRMLALNLRSGYALCRAVVPVMLKQGSGAIVNVASRTAFDHSAGASAYVASKAAAVAMIDSLAAELKGKGVRVNSIVPSIFDTEENRKAMPDADFTKWPKPDDIAKVMLFLCSDDARLIHGASIPVYGDT